MKKVLVVLPFDNVYPVLNGGMQRCINVINQLAKYFDVSIILYQEEESFKFSFKDYKHLHKVKLYSTGNKKYKGFFSLLPAKLGAALRYRFLQRSMKGPADAHFLKYYEVLKQTLKIENFDFVVLETLSAINSAAYIRRIKPGIKILLDAHNVDTNLAFSAYKKGLKSKWQYELIETVEKELYKNIDGAFCCSNDDMIALDKMNGGRLKLFVVPNGTNLPEKKFTSEVENENPHNIIFCGSFASLPNAEGLYWFCTEVWPHIRKIFTDLKLLVIGSGKLDSKFEGIYKVEGVDVIGRVDSTSEWYDKAAIAIVPLLTGSGTRLKILEAMGMGIPVVSTTIGAEGILYRDNENILIADDAEKFAEKVILLLSDLQKRKSLSENGRNLIGEIYDWEIIGEKLKRGFDNL